MAAFCGISHDNLRNFSTLTFTRIRQNPERLNAFKQFASDLASELMGRGVPPEKAIAYVSYLPQIISEYNSERENRRQLKEAGVSLDAISSVEDVFEEYGTLANFLGIKNDPVSIVPVNKDQLASEQKITDHIAKTKVSFVGDRRIINGKAFDTRVTSIAKVGFDEPFGAEENTQSPALKHGNTVDTIAKAVFDDIVPKFDDFQEYIERDAFDSLLGKLRSVKAQMEQQGYIFKTGVTLYNLPLKLSGEIDLIAINPKGEAYILDFKSANQRFNDAYLKNDTLKFLSDDIRQEVGMLSKWKQYGTQGALYGMMLKEQLGIPVLNRTGIIGINIAYDESVPTHQSKIQRMGDVSLHVIPNSDMRSEYKNKSLKEIYEEYKKLEGQSLGTVTEIKPLTKRKQKKNFDNIGPETPLDRRARIGEIAATDDQLQRELSWLRSTFGEDVVLRLDDNINSGLFGQFKLDGITIYKHAALGTGYHEGWHRFTQVFLSKKEKDDLYKSVQKDNLKFRTRDGRNIQTGTASFLDVEEFLAEEFAKYALNPTEYKYPTSNTKPKTFFQKIWEFLQRFFGINPQPIDLFHKLFRNKIGEYVPSVNNAYWGNLNSLATNSRGEEIVSNERFPLYVRTMDFLVGDQLSKYGRSFTAFKQSKALQSQVINNVFANLKEKYNDPNITDDQSDELESILENMYDFTKAYLAATAYDTLKDFDIDEQIFTLSTSDISAMEDLADKYDDVEDIDDNATDDSKPERFDRTGNEDSINTLADSPLQDFFRTIPKIKAVNPDGSYQYELNELGYPENHKYYDIFNKTKKVLSGAFDMAEMLKLLQSPANQAIFPELKLVSDFISRFINSPEEKNHYRAIQNIQFVQSFYHIMTMPEVENKQLTLNFLPLQREYKTFKPTMVSYRTASRNLSLKIIKNWEKNFKDRRGKQVIAFTDLVTNKKAQMATTPLYLTEDGKILLNPFINYKEKYPNTLKGTQDFFELIGVTFDPKVYRDADAVRELKEYKAQIINNLGIYDAAKSLEFMEAADNILTSNEIAVDDIIDIAGYIKALDEISLDELAKEYFINNPVSAFNERWDYPVSREMNGRIVSGTQSTAPLRFTFENMAEIEEKFGPRVSSGAFRIEDKTKYPYYIPNSMMITTSLLNKIENIGDFNDNLYLQHINPLKNKWMKRSYFLKQLFDQNGDRALDTEGKRLEIVLNDIASVRTITSDDQGRQIITEKHPRSLNRDEKFFMDVLTLFKAGALEIPRAETSSTMFTLQLSDYGSDSGRTRVIPITVSDVLGKGIPETFHEIVRDYLAGEIEKRQWYMQNEPDSKFATRFNVFQDILSPELRSKIERYLNLRPEEILQQEGIAGEFRAEIEKYFNDRVADIRPRFESLPKDQKDMIKDTVEAKNIQGLNSVAKAFILNHFILSTEFYNLYFGDLYFYKNPFKRGKFATNTGNTYFIDDYRNQMLNSVQNETLHTIFTGEKAGGKDFRKFKTSVITDVEMQSAYVNQDDSQNILLNDVINMRVASGALAPNTPEYIQEFTKVKNDLKKYNKINIADGQGIIGLDFYRNFSIITNIWSETKEKEYERQKAIFRNNFNLYFHINDEGNRVAMTGEELAEAKNRDKALIVQKPFDYFNPLKISYTGPQVKEGPMRPVFDKFSVRPIIPEAAIGKRDEGLLMEMVKKDIDYIKFQSGSKVYHDTTFDWFNKIGDGKYDLNDFTTEEIEPNELYSAYLKHQLSTEGIKEKNILGSQFRKIVFGIKYSPLVRNNPTLVNYFTKLEDQFRETIENLIATEQNDLFSLLGVQEKNGQYKVADMSKFIKLLVNESLKRGVAINNIEYLQYDEATKAAKYPIDYAFNRQQIQDLLSGLIDEKLRRLKINGSALIQVSSAGYENKQKFSNATREDIEKYGTTGLNYYHIEYDREGLPIRTSTMGVKVALIGSFKNLLNLEAPDSLGAGNIGVVTGMLATGDIVTSEGKPRGNKIGTLDRLNQAMKDENWKQKNMEKFIMVGYRIPTQNNNFIDHMEVMEFLPESAGAIIVPPIELIVKSGSDFDIDKMNVLIPSLVETGALHEAPQESAQEIFDAIRNATYEERDVKGVERDINRLLSKTSIDIEELIRVQRKIRSTILDLTMKADVEDSILATIMDNLESGASEILPETEDYGVDFDLFSATLDFVKADREIERMKASYEAFTKEKANLDLKWFRKKQQYKNSQNNKMIQILAKTMSHPYYFELLVTPSSASMFEDLTNKLMASEAKMSETQYQEALRANEGKLFDKVNTAEFNNRYEASAEAFDNLLSKRNDLGGFAIQRTFADLFNFIKFSIAKSYPIKDTMKVLHTPLVAPADRAKLVQNGRILMYGDSVNGISIKNSFDELISLTVDLAGSPAYPNMDINVYNRKHIQYLIHQKNDPQQVLWFLNQPVLKDLYALMDDKKRKVVGYSLKHGIVELALKMRILDNPPKFPNSSVRTFEVLASKWEQFDEERAEEEGRKGQRVFDSKRANPFLSRPYVALHNENLNEDDYFNFKDMDGAIRNRENMSQPQKDLQKKVLAYFASMIDEVDSFMQVQFANNVDTTKYSTLTSLIRNRDNRRNIRKKGLFDKAQIEMLEKQSMIAPFDYTQKAYQIQKALFPYLYTDKTIATFSELVDDIFGVKNVQIERISKIIENDYIEFVYKNFGTYNGINLSDQFESQLVNIDNTLDHEFFSFRLLELKSKYPELSDIPFVAGLYEDTYTPPPNEFQDSYRGLDNMETHNVFFLRNPDNPTFEKNIFTGNWRNLINFSPEKLGLTQNYTQAQQDEISQFFHDLVYFSLYQAGLTNTGNGFSDLIPYEYWASFIQQAFDNMKNEISKSKSLEDELLRVFAIRFKQMNPKINWQTKYVLLDMMDEEGRPLREEINFYKNYYRGKDYKVTDDDLGFVRTAVLYDDEQVADDQTIEAPEPIKATNPLETGRYVNYDGEVYIVTKFLRDKIWQIYNPLKQGAAAKIGVHERNITTRAEKGSIVLYGNKNYLVTAKGEIIDLDTNRKVSWSKDNKNRIKILELAKNPPTSPTSGIAPQGETPIEPTC